MTRNFNSNNKTKPIINRMVDRAKWEFEAYPENNGIGPKVLKNTNFLERVHYGHIDDRNNSVIPDESYMVSTESGRVFDFVADSYSLFIKACSMADAAFVSSSKPKEPPAPLTLCIKLFSAFQSSME